MDRTVHFHYCITLPIIRTVLKNVDRTVNFYYCTALPIIRTVLKNQACNIYKYWSYNRNLRVVVHMHQRMLPNCLEYCMVHVLKGLRGQENYVFR